MDSKNGKFVWLRTRSNAFLNRFSITENTFMAFIAAFIGVAAGFGNIAFRKAIGFFHWLVVENGSHFFGVTLPVDLTLGDWSPTRFYVILFPMVGGVLMLFFWIFFTKDMKFNFSRFLEVVNLHGAKIPGRIALTSGITSAITLGTGGSAGQEGPIALIGGAIGSQFGQAFKMSADRLKILVACGAAGGVAATFNAPIAGVFFGTEIILVSTFAVSSFTPIVIASTLSTAITRTFIPEAESFITPAYMMTTPWELIFYVLLGGLIGFMSAGQIDMHYRIKDFFDRLKLHRLAKPILGGLLVGAIGVFFPQVMGNGYEFMGEALSGQGAMMILAALCLLKAFATALTIGSGLPGGLFAPVLVTGSFAGGAFGKLLVLLFPGLGLIPASFALAGMGAFLAGTMHAPATAIFLVFEMTGSYQAILPIMLASVTATAIARWCKKDCLDTVELSRAGIDLEAGKERNIMKALKVKDAMESNPEVVPEDMTLGQFSDFITQAKNTSFPLVDKEGNLTGVITMQDFLGVVFDPDLKDLVVVKELASANVITTTEEEDLDTCMRKLGYRDFKQLPVVDSSRGKKLLGIIFRRDIISAYNRSLVSHSLEKRRNE